MPLRGRGGRAATGCGRGDRPGGCHLHPGWGRGQAALLGHQKDRCFLRPLTPQTGQHRSLPTQVCELGLEALRPDIPHLHKVPGALDVWPLHGPLPPTEPVEEREAPVQDAQALTEVSLSSALAGRSPACLSVPVHRLPIACGPQVPSHTHSYLC